MTIDEQDPSLESGEIDSHDGQPAPVAAPAPVVVIQYRTRGLPWYIVLPLLVLVPLGAVAVYHRVTTRAALYASIPAEITTARNAEPAAADSSLTRAALKPNGPVVPIPDAAFPLALNSHPLTRIPDALSQAHGASLHAGASSEPVTEAVAETSPSPTATPAVSSAKPVDAKPDQPDASRPAGETVASTNAEAAASPANSHPEPSSTASPAPAPVPVPVPPPPAPGLAAADQTPSPKRPPAIGFTPPSESFDPTNPFLTPPTVNTPDLSKPHAANAVDPDEMEQVDADPIEPTAPTREELLDDIAAEAARKRGELNENQKIKDSARLAMAMERREKIEEERENFRSELRKLIESRRKGMSDEIDALYSRYNGEDADPAVQMAAKYALSRGTRLTREGKVKLLSRYGVPEPNILDFLSNEIHRSINSPHGPRNAAEVRVLAAKQLLAIKPGKNQPAVAKPPQPARSRQGVAASWPPAPWAAGNR